MFKYFIVLFLLFFNLYSNDPSYHSDDALGNHLDVSQYQSNFVGSWLYVGVGLEQINEGHGLNGYRILKDFPIQAFARLGCRMHTSIQFAFDICAEIMKNNESTHNIITDLNYLYFFQTSYDAIPTYYLGIGGPIKFKSLAKILYRIDFRDLCFSNCILGKRLDAKKFIQIKFQDFRHLGFSSDKFYIPTLEKLASNTILELGLGF